MKFLKYKHYQNSLISVILMCLASGLVSGFASADTLSKQAAESKSTQTTWIRTTPQIPVEKQSYMQAIKLGNYQRVHAHLKNGVAVDDKQDGKYTGLFSASAKGRLNIAKLLVTHGANVNSLGPGRWTPIMIAAFHGHIEVVDLLAKHGAKLEQQNYEGKSALMLAIENKQVQAAERLIRAGANINAQLFNDKMHGKSVLAIAIQNACSTCIDLLLKHKARIDVANPVEAAPLVQAAIQNDLPTLKKLVNAGVKINQQYSEANNVLHLAAPFITPEVAEFFIMNGLKTAQKNQTGKTPLIIAGESGNVAVFERLLSKAKTIERNEAMFAVSAKGLKDLVSVLVNAGVDINIQNVKGETPLMMAAAGRHAVLVEYLLEAGANRTIRNNKGETALAYAKNASIVREDVVAMLVDVEGYGGM